MPTSINGAGADGIYSVPGTGSAQDAPVGVGYIIHGTK